MNTKLIKQNLNICEEKIKLLVIGDKEIGKTLLINSLLNDETDENFSSRRNYQPTTS